MTCRKATITVKIWDNILEARISREIEIKIKEGETLQQAVKSVMFYLHPVLDGLCNESFLISGLSKTF